MATRRDSMRASSESSGPRYNLTLERVLGVTVDGNTMMAVNPVDGDVAYAAGCIVVIYKIRRHKQVRYYRVEKPVSCLCFSPDGRYLAIGEKGYQPSITIWDCKDGSLTYELQRHQYSIACLAFTTDGSFLLSCGQEEDQRLYAWDMLDPSKEDRVIGIAKVEEKVYAITYSQADQYFVSVGERHVKFWYLDGYGQFIFTGYEVDGLPELHRQDAVLNTKANTIFVDICSGHGCCQHKTYAIATDGTVCCFNGSAILETTVSLETQVGNALHVTEAYVAVGGSNGTVRLFSPTDLEYIATLPFPPALGMANAPLPFHDSEAVSPVYSTHRYPAVVAVRLTGSSAIVLYSDHSLFIYDIDDIAESSIHRAFLYHSGPVKDLHVVGKAIGRTKRDRVIQANEEKRLLQAIPTGSFVTCSVDNTVRVWNLEVHKQTGRHTDRGNQSKYESMWTNQYSKEMLRLVYYDSDDAFEDSGAFILGGTAPSTSVRDVRNDALKHNNYASTLQTLAIHPNGTSLVAGASDGNIMAASFDPDHEEEKEVVGVHMSELTKVMFRQNGTGDSYQVVTGGKDRLVKVYEEGKWEKAVSQAQPHARSIKTLWAAANCKVVVSGASDSTLAFSDIKNDGSHSLLHSIELPTSIYDICGTVNGKRIIVTHGNRLDMYDVDSKKQMKSYYVGEQHRIAICPADYCIALGGSPSDMTLRVVEMDTGETLAETTGHGDVVSGVQFTPDCRRLISVSKDGCIFVWRLSEAFQKAIKAKLPRQDDGQSIAIPKPVIQTDEEEKVMPPPAPPQEVSKTKNPLRKTYKNDDTQAKASSPSNGSISRLRRHSIASSIVDSPGRKSPKHKGSPHSRVRRRSSKSMKNLKAASALPEEKPPAKPSSIQKEILNAEAIPTIKVETQETGKVDQTARSSIASKISLPGKEIAFKQKIKHHTLGSAVQTNHSVVGKSLLFRSNSYNNNQPSTIDVSSSTLATERTGMARKQRQKQTAEAVEAMTMKLSRLGMWKPDKYKQSQASESIAEDVKAAEVAKDDISLVNESISPNDLSSEKGRTDDIEQQQSNVDEEGHPMQEKDQGEEMEGSFDVPPEMFQSIEVPKSIERFHLGDGDGVVQETEIIDNDVSDAGPLGEQEYQQESLVMGKSAHSNTLHEGVDGSVAASYSMFTSGYAQSSDVARPSSVDESISIPTGASLSTFTSGFQAPKNNPARILVSSTNESQEKMHVDSSISAFTNGYQNGVNQSNHTRSSVAPLRQTLSAFTEGYADHTEAECPGSDNDDSDLISSSLSKFTEGYEQHAGNESVSGVHSTASPVLSSVAKSLKSELVKESLSLFTDGYVTIEKDDLDQDSTTTSSPNSQQCVKVSETDPKKVIKVMRNLESQLEATESEMVQLGDTAGLGEIRSLMQQLRTRIQEHQQK